MTPVDLFRPPPVRQDLTEAEPGLPPQHVLVSDGTFEYEAVFQRRSDSRSLLVFLPAALMDDPAQRKLPSIPRWRWGQDFNASYISLSDCPLAEPLCVGSWFQGNPTSFAADTLASWIEAIAHSWGVPTDRVIIYGSSMGGFGALMIGARLPASHVVAEVPQTDLLTYGNQAAIGLASSQAYGEPIERIALQMPDRVNVVSRFRRLGAVPNITLIHDHDDRSGVTQIYPFLRGLFDAIQTGGMSTPEIKVLFTRGRGHVALPFEEAKPIINRILRTMEEAEAS